jgi:hypothetical protein
VINPTESAQQLELSIKGVELAGKGHLWRMAPANINATNVEVEELTLDAVPTTPTFAPFSVNIYGFPVK